MTDTLTLIRPDDWHIHLRDGDALIRTVPDAARSFGRVIAMPNLVPPVSNTAEALAYRERILAHVPAGNACQPLMVLYLTDNTDPQEIARAKASDHVVACKLYPAGATTNAESGVTNIRKIYPVLEAMQKAGIAFLVHGEVTDVDTDIFDREKIFLTEVLSPVLRDFPELKTVVEHITTREAVHFVSAAPAHVGATITAHHLLFNRNHMLAGGIRPHYYCLPVLKRNIHQEALIQAATGGNPKFFLGTDSAPHAQHKKENACGCAGCYTASHALELYAEAFDRACALHRLEAFASLHGADFYGVPRNTTHVTLRKAAWQVPATLSFGGSTLVPLLAGETLHWQLTP